MYTLKKEQLAEQFSEEKRDQRQYEKTSEQKLKRHHTADTNAQPKEIRLKDRDLREKASKKIQKETNLYKSQKKACDAASRKKFALEHKPELNRKCEIIWQQYETDREHMINQEKYVLKTSQEEENRVLKAQLEREFEDLEAGQKLRSEKLKAEKKSKREKLEGEQTLDLQNIELDFAKAKTALEKDRSDVASRLREKHRLQLEDFDVTSRDMGFHTIVHIPKDLQNRNKVASPTFSTSSSMTSGHGTFRSAYTGNRHFY